jgi:hypothetical protein
VAVTKTNCCPKMHITPKLNSCFQFPAGHTKKNANYCLLILRLEWTRVERVHYLLGVPITKIIPGRRLAKFPLFSFNASTVVLWDLAIEESVSPRCTL